MDGTILLRRRAAAALTVLGAGLGLMAAGPGDAFAGTLSLSGSVVTYSGTGAAEDPLVTDAVVDGDDVVTVSDPAGVVLGAGCTSAGGGAAECRAASITEVRMLMGGGDDRVRAATVDLPMEIDGNPGRDTLIGGTAADEIDGGDDADAITGNGGSDAIFGGGDRDVISGNAGDDRIEGQIGDDALSGGDGLDVLLGEIGDDTLQGGAQRDVLTGGDGRDALHGGSGDDDLSGQGGADRLFGNSGFDRYFGGTHADTVDAVDDRDEPVDCGAGGDTADLNLGDTNVGGSCETVAIHPKVVVSP